jgi:hypothetical protein
MAQKPMDAARLRAWYAHRQGLDGSLNGKSATEVLAAAGWARSVGGAAPYLTLFSRAGISREAADAAVAHLDIYELPSARGCTYVVPAGDFALALQVGRDFAGADMKAARKLGVTDKEIDKLSEIIVHLLAKAQLDPEQLREAAGKAVRSLGEAGRKKGITTTLPLALGPLQAAGRIRRVPTNGRLDQQRYRYTAWIPSPLAGYNLSLEQSYTELARRYFRWIGPATLAEFQWFSGLGVKVSQAAIRPLKLVPLDEGDNRLMFADDLDSLRAFTIPKQPHYVLTSSLDGISLLRRDLKGLLAEADLKQSIFADKGFSELGGLADLPDHAILDRGRLVGLWAFDPDKGTIAWMSFIKPDKALLEAVSRMEAFVRDQLGDARSFSLDSPKSRAPRIEALRKLGYRP